MSVDVRKGRAISISSAWSIMMTIYYTAVGFENSLHYCTIYFVLLFGTHVSSSRAGCDAAMDVCAMNLK